MLNRYDTGSIIVPEKAMFNLRIDTDMRTDLKAMADEQGRSTHNMVIYILRLAIEKWKQERDNEARS